MRKLIFIAVLTSLFIGCSSIPQSEYEYIDIPNQTKEK